MSDDKEENIKSQFDILLGAATRRMLSALGAYHIWKWMNVAINTNAPGGKAAADRNVAIMNRHNIFFMQLRDSTYKTFVVDLWIFFDKENYQDAFSLDKLIESTRDKLTDAQIAEIRKKIEAIRRKQGINIGFVQTLRNADVAHQEISSQPRHLNYADIESLFGAVQEILNVISNRYDKSVHWWQHVEQEVNRQMRWVLDDLERGELLRLKEMRENRDIEK